MKDQYFGDVKDLFKYDLVQWIIERIPSLDRFAFITMLTKNDGGSDGNKLDYEGRPGYRNQELVGYLRERVEERRRNVSEIRCYYESRGIRIDIYKENEYFKHGNRVHYFAEIPDEYLAHSVIMVDPDNGLEVKRSNQRHFLLNEAADLYRRMNDESILIIFQHFRREKHDVTLEKVSVDLGAACGEKPLFICDKETIFFMLTKKKELKSELARVLAVYAQEYPVLKIGNPGEPKDDSVLFK
jgi:hypothetical protein